MRKKWFLFISFLFLWIWPQQGFASEFNFSVNFDLPENQIDKSKTYLDLQMSPNQKQEISYTLFNDTDQDITVNILVRSATTNANGVIEYGESLSKKDASLPYDLEKLVQTVDSVKVPAKGTTKQTLTIQAPEKEFSGIVAGGITFQEPVSSETNKKTVGVVNRYSQVKAILLRNNQETVTPDLVLTKAFADQSNARNIIAVNLQNPEPAYMFGLSTKVSIFKKGQEKAYLTMEKNELNMAPNTNFDLAVPLNGKQLEPGKYQATVQAKWEDKEWNLKTDFEITSKTAKSYNAKDIDLQEEPSNNYLWWVIIGGLLVIIIIMGLVLYKNKKGDK